MHATAIFYKYGGMCVLILTVIVFPNYIYPIAIIIINGQVHVFKVANCMMLKKFGQKHFKQ